MVTLHVERLFLANRQLKTVGGQDTCHAFHIGSSTVLEPLLNHFPVVLNGKAKTRKCRPVHDVSPTCPVAGNECVDECMYVCVWTNLHSKKFLSVQQGLSRDQRIQCGLFCLVSVKDPWQHELHEMFGQGTFAFIAAKKQSPSPSLKTCFPRNFFKTVSTFTASWLPDPTGRQQVPVSRPSTLGRQTSSA